MKKQITKIILKTDKIVSLSKAQTQYVAGGMRAVSFASCGDPYCGLSQATLCKP